MNDLWIKILGCVGVVLGLFFYFFFVRESSAEKEEREERAKVDRREAYFKQLEKQNEDFKLKEEVGKAVKDAVEAERLIMKSREEAVENAKKDLDKREKDIAEKEKKSKDEEERVTKLKDEFGLAKAEHEKRVAEHDKAIKEALESLGGIEEGTSKSLSEISLLIDGIGKAYEELSRLNKVNEPSVSPVVLAERRKVQRDVIDLNNQRIDFIQRQMAANLARFDLQMKILSVSHR